MEQKINIAELLKDCPKGMELDCTMIDNVVFEKLDVRSSHHPIIIRRTDSKDSNTTIHLTKYGQYSDEEDYKCVIFPKGKTTWGEFEPPYKFKDGDIVTWKDGGGSLVACIYKERLDISFSHHIALYKGGLGIIVNGEIISTNDELCIATEEEKQKLFQAIKDNGYMWNEETKTLEKLPKFKVGDKIRHKTNNKDIYEISAVYNDFYGLVDFAFMLDMKYQDLYELVPTKFDITTLVPFESRVLVRNHESHKWSPAMWGYYDCDSQNYPYIIVGDVARYCIPYEGNEYLLGTPDDCEKYFKTW